MYFNIFNRILYVIGMFDLQHIIVGEERSGTPTVDEREQRSAPMPQLHPPPNHMQAQVCFDSNSYLCFNVSMVCVYFHF